MVKIIELKKVCKTYHPGKKSQVKAICNVSVNIEKGEFIAIVGRSGSGKSTLMNLLGLLDKPSSGSYILDGENITKVRDKKSAFLRAKKIGFVFQSFNLLPRATVLNNVLLPTAYSHIKNKKEKAMSIIKSVGLGRYASKKVDELSGGEKQRVAIARALINDPEIILADEPTGNLDVKTGKEIMKLLSELTKKGKTVILVTHDLELAKGVDRIIKIEDGKVKR
ncbi:ABC transporter ATP-binding protein [Patescibacteria group bacterium]|jgi:putative ABC transport system ATP-binding protein|nr:ABC transporter ATP-binding protein [Patescibacteria group bacterium]